MPVTLACIKPRRLLVRQRYFICNEIHAVGSEQSRSISAANRRQIPTMEMTKKGNNCLGPGNADNIRESPTPLSDKDGKCEHELSRSEFSHKRPNYLRLFQKVRYRSSAEKGFFEKVCSSLLQLLRYLEKSGL
jgi:hypothetical protein